MNTIAVVDCGMGNLHSVIAGIKRAQPNATLSVAADADSIAAADKVIFPGDGNFGACMDEIDARGLRTALIEAAQQKPFLGICVGMQVLFNSSDESNQKGLGLFDGTVKHLPQQQLKTPHMGWNTATIKKQHPLINQTADGEYFYFIHSYYAPLGDWTVMTCDYGVTFSAVIGRDNVVATQFHPEKSGTHGIRLLENFLHT